MKRKKINKVAEVKGKGKSLLRERDYKVCEKLKENVVWLKRKKVNDD